MIKGALIFAAGLALGYAKAVSEQESVNTLMYEAREFIQAAKDARVDADKADASTPETPDEEQTQP